jgi:hypothetical protein
MDYKILFADYAFKCLTALSQSASRRDTAGPASELR